MAAMPIASLRRKLRHVGEGVPARRLMYFATVAWLTSMPSFSSSPWMRGAHHNGLALFIRRIRSRTSRSTDGRRRIVRFDVTQHPTAAWLSQQVIEAFPWETAPSFLLRDRDASYGSVFSKRVAAMGITEVVTASRSPWQNAYVERVIGSIRRECLDHVIVFNERHLRYVLSSYADYYHRARTHLSLDKDCPHSRAIQAPRSGRIIAIPQVGGLHHRYQRLAA
jgi:transposase InsO family protein